MPLSSANMPEGAAQPAAAQQLQAQLQAQQQPPSGGSGTDLGSQMAGSAKPSSSAAFGGNGAFKPTAAVRPLAPSTLAELPRAGSQPLSAAQAQPSGRQVHAALDLFYRDLQGFAAAVQLERVPADGEAAGEQACLRCDGVGATARRVLRSSALARAAPRRPQRQHLHSSTMHTHTLSPDRAPASAAAGSFPSCQAPPSSLPPPPPPVQAPAWAPRRRCA